MQPFDYSLWGLIFAVVVGLAATLALLESLWPDDATIHGGGGGGGVTWRRVARLLYHSFAANLQVDDDEWRSRCVRYVTSVRMRHIGGRLRVAVNAAAHPQARNVLLHHDHRGQLHRESRCASHHTHL